MNNFIGRSYIYHPSIICSYPRVLISIQILVISCNFAAKFIYNFNLRCHFVNFCVISIVRSILVITKWQIISFRRPFISSQAGGKFYFSLSNLKRFPVLLLYFAGNLTRSSRWREQLIPDFEFQFGKL